MCRPSFIYVGAIYPYPRSILVKEKTELLRPGTQIQFSTDCGDRRNYITIIDSLKKQSIPLFEGRKLQGR